MKWLFRGGNSFLSVCYGAQLYERIYIVSDSSELLLLSLFVGDMNSCCERPVDDDKWIGPA